MLQPLPPSGLVTSSRYPYPNMYPGTSSHHRIPGALFAATEPGSYKGSLSQTSAIANKYTKLLLYDVTRSIIREQLGTVVLVSY